MRLVYKSLVVFAAPLLLLACSSKNKNKDQSQSQVAARPLDTTALLAYNPKNADKKIDAVMQELHRTRGFNGNVLVAKKGKIVYEKAIGWADYLHRDSLKIGSQFELASVTKTMTSTAILQLMERGKLKLDDDVKKFFPDFPYDGVTIRLLLTHRSGMMNYVYFIDDIYRKNHLNQRKGLTNAEAMKMIADYKPTRFNEPNKRFLYNNSNFMVLGSIIEKVSGMSYAQFMQENVFKPASMAHTHVYSKAVYNKIPVDVVGHDRGQWRYSVVQNFLDGPVGDKGIYSTVGDLFLFDRALRAGLLLKPATLDSAYVPRNPMVHGHFNYGYGWRTFTAPGEEVIYHTGWWHGFRHIYLRDMKHDITIVLLTNLANGSLLKLDDLFKAAGMPIVRKSAYNGNGDTSDD
ncbi:beta-lactamase family protein [Mucilaginibacter rubeus]|uniref:Beta-lactamase family protein n=1 Tax=Mucilaginibacter rubeus TaxID=2027860 RepID=A0AAE6MLK2_9SPHI|nr:MULTISPECIES: serine hydrolase domain-containing protein [Mucilaginibacter]QEM07297.1 beta-lactamase family protein [Mucilaginibacter rubeus]QEM19750.1 beta-lactamase family protein [Mucilaginibacter gossypii]QTE43547.1 beta-lactamase family protein [Mucilaginibacter rubeus]QTE50147.1 beta-lactamase family protein [Mucilaginibacter rubeus]QTE55236.1 beta-lactamase family protein [Mucilaginibacter rubeus]